MKAVKGVVGSLALVAIALGILVYLDRGDPAGARERFIQECRTSTPWQTHEPLLLSVIDDHHGEIYRRNHKRVTRRIKTLNWEAYRAELYIELVKALDDAGHRDATMELERFRIVGKTPPASP